jgi:hypothetical protein
MTHEPECPERPCLCLEHGYPCSCGPCICDLVRAAYRRGFNDHAAAQQHWQDTHGAYRQHGEGTNP